MNTTTHPAQADRTKPRDVKVGQVWTAPGVDEYVIESIDGHRVNYADRKGWDTLHTLQFDPDYQLLKDVSPPLAPSAPAPVERRAGQRWRVTYEKRKHYQMPPGVIELTSPRIYGWNCTNIKNASFADWINDRHWEDGNEFGASMTLLSDAPATSEPGRLPLATNVVVNPAFAAPPAQEAAKAHDFSDRYCVYSYRGKLTPACKDCGLGRSMASASELAAACVPDARWRERYDEGRQARFKSTAPLTGILRDEAVAERLPRPRLTHSSTWADEAEDTQ